MKEINKNRWKLCTPIEEILWIVWNNLFPFHIHICCLCTLFILCSIFHTIVTCSWIVIHCLPKLHIGQRYHMHHAINWKERLKEIFYKRIGKMWTFLMFHDALLGWILPYLNEIYINFLINHAQICTIHIPNPMFIVHRHYVSMHNQLNPFSQLKCLMFAFTPRRIKTGSIDFDCMNFS